MLTSLRIALKMSTLGKFMYLILSVLSNSSDLVAFMGVYIFKGT